MGNTPAAPAFRSLPDPIVNLQLKGFGMEALPDSLGGVDATRLAQLETLSLSSNCLTHLPAYPSSLVPSLTHLDLSNNTVEEWPAALCHLPSLLTLDLTCNALTALPDEIGHLCTLIRLIVPDNTLSSLPLSLGTLPVLTDIDLAENCLTELPAALRTLTNLRRLNLEGNTLTTLRPSSCWADLRDLIVRNNNLTEFDAAELVSLRYLNLDDNELIEPPAHLESCIRLVSVSLAGNALTTLPDSWRTLTALESLDVSRNSIASLPLFASSRLPALTTVDLRGNALPFLPHPLREGVEQGLMTVLDSLPHEVLDRLFIGGSDAAQNIASLRHCSISHILTVANKIKPPFPNDFTYMVVEVEDSYSEDLVNHFFPCIDFIETALRGPDGCVFVHCLAGASRSATVVAAYLMYTLHLNVADALCLLKNKHDHTSPNSSFLGQLEVWHQHMCMGRHFKFPLALTTERPESGRRHST